MQSSTYTTSPVEWKPINSELNLSTFKHARRQLHEAIQLISAASRSLLPSEEKDEQSYLYWMPAQNLLTGKPIGYNRPHQLALDVIKFRLVSLDRDGKELASFSLSGKSQIEALAWMNEQVSTNIPIKIELPYELPHAPMRASQAYKTPDLTSLKIACACFTNASLLFGPLALEIPETSLPACQPDNFDFKITSLIGEKEGVTQSIEMGMSLGDTDYSLPYFYVSPQPSPEAADLPYHHGIGKWHTFPWTGLVLDIESVNQLSPNPAQQQNIVENFLKSAFEICLGLF